MKIATISIHSQNNNYGSILQAYGLKQYLEMKGYDSQIIDYRPLYSNGAIGIKGKVIAFIKNIMFFPYFLIRTRRFNEFIRTNDNLTERRYKNFQELYDNPPIADIYISGSDQIWNPSYMCGKDKSYFLKFTDSKNKIAYASSIGNTELSDEEYSFILKNIEDYRHVSVRENDSQLKLIEKGCKAVKHVCDPVFLLSIDQYRKISKNKEKERYILVYSINKDPFLEEIVDKVSSVLKIKVISIGGFAKKCKCDKFPRGIGPREFLGYMDNAEVVITSSFHGTAFSLIFNKQFIIVPPKTNRLRLDSILEIAGLCNRIVSSSNEVDDLLNKEIDYNMVNLKLESFISASKKFLTESIEDVILGANKLGGTSCE